jgi:hypothetical protein
MPLPWLLSLLVAPFLLGSFVMMTRRTILQELRAGDFPDIEPQDFIRWQRLEKKAINTYLWSFGIWVVMSGGALWYTFSYATCDMSMCGFGLLVYLIYFLGACSIVFAIGVVTAAIYASQARHLRQQLGIQWPSQ